MEDSHFPFYGTTTKINVAVGEEMKAEATEQVEVEKVPTPLAKNFDPAQRVKGFVLVSVDRDPFYVQISKISYVGNFDPNDSTSATGIHFYGEEALYVDQTPKEVMELIAEDQQNR